MGICQRNQWQTRTESNRQRHRTRRPTFAASLHSETLEPRSIPSATGVGTVETSESLQGASVDQTDAPTSGTGSLSGHVFLDLNDDGVFNVGESGIPGVTVTLRGTDSLGQSIQVTLVTDAQGRYEFTSLPAGIYTIEQTQPPGYVDGWDRIGSLGGLSQNDRFTQIALEAGQVGEGFDFGEKPSGSTTYRLYVAGYIYIDINNNGIRDAGNEPGIRGQTVTLQSDAGFSATVTTDEYGKFIFVEIPAGTYSIIEYRPSGFLDGIDMPGEPYGGVAGPIGTDRFTNLVLPVQSLIIGDNYNFGELMPGEIAGFVYVDSNNNGQRESTEDGIAGVVVTLRGINDLGESIVRTTRTSAHGEFRFTGLRPGNYSLSVSPVDGFTEGMVSVGNRGGRVESGQITDIIVDGWTRAEGYLFAKKPVPRTSRIEGFVYNDRNNNGLKEATEPGIEGVEILLIGGGRELRTTTGPDGSFLFVVDRPGTYTLIENLDEPTRGLIDGKDSFGSTFRGTVDNDRMTVFVELNQTGRGFLFGELTLADMVASEANSGGPRTPSPLTSVLAGSVGFTGNSPSSDVANPNLDIWQIESKEPPSSLSLSVTGLAASRPATSVEAFSDAGVVISDSGLVSRAEELFGSEIPILEDTEDDRLNESMAGTLLTGGRMQTRAGLRRGASLGNVAVLTQTEGDDSSDRESSLNSESDLSLLQNLIGLELPMIQSPADPGGKPERSKIAAASPVERTDSPTSIAENDESKTKRQVIAGTLSSGVALLAGRMAFDIWQIRRARSRRRRENLIHDEKTKP